MNFDYFEEAEWDLPAKFADLIDPKGMIIDPKTGKLVLRGRIPRDIPWLKVDKVENEDRDCPIYMQIVQYFSFIPTRCLNCWKVVARPKTVEDLIKVHVRQTEMNLPAKCGIEKRGYVPALYGAYWYNDTVEEGLECLKTVREEMAKINPEIPVILKRGCTEYELRLGASTEWDNLPTNPELEKYILDNVVLEFRDVQAPDYLKRSIMRQWIEYAYEHGDETYKKFTNGKPMKPRLVTYE